MRFIIVTTDHGEYAWINMQEIALMAPKAQADYNTVIILKNGHSIRAMPKVENIVRIIQKQGEEVGIKVGFEAVD